MQQQNEVNEIKSRIRNLFVGSIEDFNKFSAAIQNMTVPELKDVLYKLQVGAAHRAETKLKAVQAGLDNAPSNWAKIEQRLGPYFDIVQFRHAVQSDQAFRDSLQWHSEPFAYALQAEQEQSANEQQRRREFSAVIKVLAASGTANVADNEANYRLCADQLDDLLVAGTVQGSFVSALTQAISRNLIAGLFPNDSETTQEIDADARKQLLVSIEGRLDNPFDPTDSVVRRKIQQQDSYTELRERAQLCTQLADSYSPSIANNNQHFRSLFVAKTSNVQYRKDVVTMLERKKFAAMTPQEIRDYNRHQQTQPQPKQLSQAEAIRLEAEQSGLPPLPEKDGNGVPIDAAYINKVSVTNKQLFSAWLQRFGRANVVGRMMGVR